MNSLSSSLAFLSLIALPVSAQPRLFPQGFSACDLVSIEEATEATGEQLQQPEAGGFGGQTHCTFRSQADASVNAVLIIMDFTDADFDGHLEEVEEVLAGQSESIEMLDGLGDRAFYVQYQGHHVIVAARGRGFSLTIHDNPDIDNRDKAIDLARKMVERLP